MVLVKRRQEKVAQLSNDWVKRIYRYGVLEMSNKIGMPSMSLYKKLQGRSSFFDDEVKKIDSEIKRHFQKESEALQK
jgi:predicted transcriptional regulator